MWNLRIRSANLNIMNIRTARFGSDENANKSSYVPPTPRLKSLCIIYLFFVIGEIT